MKKIIFVAGIPATGKSTFARELSKCLSVPCFHKDTIKETIGKEIAASTREQSLMLSRATFQLLVHLADTFIGSGKPLILESNFRHEECEALKNLLAEYDAMSLDYVFTGDMQRIFARFRARDAIAERAAIHKTHGMENVEIFQSNVESLAWFSSGGHTIQVDTTDFSLVDFPKLIDEAARFLQQ